MLWPWPPLDSRLGLDATILAGPACNGGPEPVTPRQEQGPYGVIQQPRPQLPNLGPLREVSPLLNVGPRLNVCPLLNVGPLRELCPLLKVGPLLNMGPLCALLCVPLCAGLRADGGPLPAVGRLHLLLSRRRVPGPSEGLRGPGPGAATPRGGRDFSLSPPSPSRVIPCPLSSLSLDGYHLGLSRVITRPSTCLTRLPPGQPSCHVAVTAAPKSPPAHVSFPPAPSHLVPSTLPSSTLLSSPSLWLAPPFAGARCLPGVPCAQRIRRLQHEHRP